jgi:nucleotide-binding universal stress UspA family protein
MSAILVGLDFSPAHEHVLATAVALARATGADLALLHIAPEDPEFIGYEPGPPAVRDSVAQAFREQRQKLEAEEARLRADGLPVTARTIQGPVAAKLLQEAERMAVDWMVVGSHGRSGVRRLLLGSVSEAVVRGAPCPVVIVPIREAATSALDPHGNPAAH